MLSLPAPCIRQKYAFVAIIDLLIYPSDGVHMSTVYFFFLFLFLMLKYFMILSDHAANQWLSTYYIETYLFI